MAYEDVAGAAVNPWAWFGAKLGGEALGGLAGLIAGPTWQEKERRGLVGRLRRGGGQTYRPQDFEGLRYNIERGNVDYLNRLAQRLSRAGILKGGQGMGEILRGGQSELSRLLTPEMARGLHYEKQLPFEKSKLIAMLTG